MSQRVLRTPTDKEAPALAYPLMRIALERFQKPVAELSKKEYAAALSQAQKLYDMEAAVMQSPEAANVVIAAEQIDAAVAQVAARFPERENFLNALSDNGLDEDSLATALYRELMFDAVMNKVSSNAAQVSDLDVQIYYHMHPEKFNAPDTRRAQHILITINPDYPENTRKAARERIETVAADLKGEPAKFSDLALSHSECPTAMQGGELGYVKQGQLYPELDEVLFEMAEGDISDILESETGFHILQCTEIKPAHNITLEQAKGKIRAFLEERQRNMCQKTWLQKLTGQKNG